MDEVSTFPLLLSDLDEESGRLDDMVLVPPVIDIQLQFSHLSMIRLACVHSILRFRIHFIVVEIALDTVE